MTSVEQQRIMREMEERRATYRKQDSVSQEESRLVMQEFYAEWIKNDKYEKDMEVLGFENAGTLAETVSQFVSDKNGRILDCASGTGLVGLELKNRGFLRIDALDAHKESLDSSRGKQVYTNYICEYLGQNRLPIEDDTYDAITMSAAFGSAHVQPDCFPELLRIIKPGGYAIFSVSEGTLILDECCKNGKLDDIFHKMAAKGTAEYVEKKRHVYIQCGHDGTPEYCYVFVLRVM